jgi:allantoin racemase
MNTRRIRVISPVIADGRQDADELEGLYAGPGTTLDHTFLDAGPASVESEWQHALAVPEIMHRVMEAQEDGVDAVVISCMEDPGLGPGRELATIPVLGTAQTSMHLAALLAHRFSIVTTDGFAVPGFENLARKYALDAKLASVRWVDIPVLDLFEDEERVRHSLVAQSIAAVREDGAHAIVFGCTGMTGAAARVEQGLADAGITGVPVIDPLPATVCQAAALLDLGLTHSKATSPQPPAGPIAGYGFANADALGAFAR